MSDKKHIYINVYRAGGKLLINKIEHGLAAVKNST